MISPRFLKEEERERRGERIPSGKTIGEGRDAKGIREAGGWVLGAGE
jgi:hypothetical protein